MVLSREFFFVNKMYYGYLFVGLCNMISQEASKTLQSQIHILLRDIRERGSHKLAWPALFGMAIKLDTWHEQDFLLDSLVQNQIERVLDSLEVEPDKHACIWLDPVGEALEVLATKATEHLAAFLVECGDSESVFEESLVAPRFHQSVCDRLCHA